MPALRVMVAATHLDHFEIGDERVKLTADVRLKADTNYVRKPVHTKTTVLLT
jgi:hypothetical protein